MGLIATINRTGPDGLPRAPYDLQEEVEAYARETGRTAKLHFVPYGGWFARFSLRCNDRRMILFQQGMASEPPTEDVFFHVPNPRAARRGESPYLPLDILQMGPSGIRQFLERGNTWSGRGVFSSHEEALRHSTELNAESKVRMKATKKEESRFRQRDKRRSRLKIPFLTVGIDLEKEKPAGD